MEWAKMSNIQSMPLFAYQDNMVRNGWFDIYNQWLFGQIEDKLQFEAWGKFHEGAIDSFLNWKKSNPLVVKKNSTLFK